MIRSHDVRCPDSSTVSRMYTLLNFMTKLTQSPVKEVSTFSSENYC